MTIGDQRLYESLCEVLDSLRSEAPAAETVYHPSHGNQEGLIHARSRALLHLFLKARFGLVDHETRERYVTDGRFDGGIDAFYIDEKGKRLFILQSKFRANAVNFFNAYVSPTDLLKMDVKRILSGEKKAEDGSPYNDRITGVLQREIKRTVNIGSYKTEVVLLGNTKNLAPSHLNRLVQGLPVEQLPHTEIYSQLLFPVVNGTYYNDPNLTIEINLSNLRSSESNLAYDARTKSQKTNIKLCFVPTREIGRIMTKYRNSILRFNPRSFLELETNPVNQQIASSVTDKKTNEFALFNNGITIIADETAVSSNTGRKGAAQLVLLNPQLVNGAQTAYTLARIYDRCEKSGSFGIFRGKEVLLKIITFTGKKKDLGARNQLIGAISKASNSQTRVDEFDRRSNDPIQVALQHEFFIHHGLFYERKRGEFSDGLHEGYISDELLVPRDKLLRVILASKSLVSQARSSLSKYSGEKELSELLKVSEAAKYAFGYEILKSLEKRRRQRPSYPGDRYHTREYGQALRYGQYAVVNVCTNDARTAGLTETAALSAGLNQWTAFEAWASKRRSNRSYIAEDGSFSFVNYYKGSTLNVDLATYRFKFKKA